jgi:small subunit ribosomal protein S2
MKAGRAVRVPGRRLFSISAQQQQQAPTADAVEAAETAATPEALLNQLRTQPVRAFDKVQNSRELNEEFDSFIKEFVTDANISSVFPQLNPPSQVKKSAASASSNTSSSSSQIGRKRYPNLRVTPANDAYSNQELFLRREHQARVLGGLGSTISNVYRPHEDVLKPKAVEQTTLETLLAAGLHLGHSTSLFRPSTQPYIYGERDGIHIINLDQTIVHLRRAAKVAEKIAEEGGLILFVGTRPGQQRSLELAAKRAGGYYVHKRWVPGTLTNSREISNLWEKHEVNMGDRPTERLLSPRLKRSLIKPDLVVLLNPVENRNAIYECIQSNVPTVGIVDTDSEASLLTYPIPGNDDSIRGTDLIAGVLSKAAERGRKRRLAGFEKHVKQKQAREAAAAAQQ